MGKMTELSFRLDVCCGLCLCGAFSMVRGIFQSIKALNAWFGREPWTPLEEEISFQQSVSATTCSVGLYPVQTVATPSDTCVENRSGVD